MRLLRIATVAKAFTHIVGVPVAIITFILAVYSSWDTISSASKTFQLSKVSALSESRKIFGDYDGMAKTAIRFNNDVDSGVIPDAFTLLKKYGSGEKMYHCDELKDFRIVKEYFEQMGSFIRLGYLDFELFFSIIAFPDSFWNKSRSYREVISKNWSKERCELKDFDLNMNNLYLMYVKKRKELKL